MPRFSLGSLFERLFLYTLRTFEVVFLVWVIGFSSPIFDQLEFGRTSHVDQSRLLKRISEQPDIEDRGLSSSAETEIVEEEPEEPGPSSLDLIGTEYTGRGLDHRRFIGGCRPEFQVDCDGNGEPEDLCFQSMTEAKEGDIPKHYLLIDVYRDKEWVVRQKIGLGFYWQERYFDFVDLDGDGEAELVTQVRLGPDCSGCGAYRIHTVVDCAFYNVLNVFGLSPDDSRVKKVLKMLDRIDPVETVGFDRARKPGELAVCNDEDFFQEDCSPWLVLSGGKTLLVHTLTYRGEGAASIKRRAGVLVMEVSEKGTLGRQRFFEYPEKTDEVTRSAIGFLRTGQGKVHLLTTIDYSGTSIGYPVLEVLELQGLGFKPVGEFSGFYHHVIPERLIDFDGDGTTEIVYVSESVWPPGGAHADEIPIYGIAEYRQGKYSEADKKHDAAGERINRFFEQKLAVFLDGRR